MANSLLRVRNGASTSDNCMYSFPEICSSVSCQIRTLEMGSLSRFEPLFLLRLLPPDQAWPFFAILHPPPLIEIRRLRKRILDAAEIPLHLEACLRQSASPVQQVLFRSWPQSDSGWPSLYPSVRPCGTSYRSLRLPESGSA